MRTATPFAIILTFAAFGCRKPAATYSTSTPVTAPVSGAVASPVIDGDLRRLQGEWKLTVLERGSSRFTYGKEALSSVLSVSGDKLNRRWLGRAGVMQAKLDSSTTPCSIDLIFLDPEGAVAKTYFTLPNGQLEVLEGRVSGIYELKGDDLKICFPDTANTPRPRDFTLTNDPDRTVLTLRRSE